MRYIYELQYIRTEDRTETFSRFFTSLKKAKEYVFEHAIAYDINVRIEEDKRSTGLHHINFYDGSGLYMTFHTFKRLDTTCYPAYIAKREVN